MNLSPARRRGLLTAFGALLMACHPGPPVRADAPAELEWTTPLSAPCDTTPAAPHRGLGGLSAADRDSLVQDVQARRAAWRARGITDYRVRIAMACFCPFSPPAILEVRGGIPVALRDSTGRPAGAPREPYAYTIEGLFDLIERTARNDELVEVSYSPCLGYPTSVRVDPKGLDNWYWVTADHLTTPPSQRTSAADSSAVWRELEQRYDENRRALLAKDFGAIMALRTDDFHAVTPDSAVHDRAEMEQATHALLEGIDRWITLTFDVDSLEVSGDLARAVVRQHADRMARRSDGRVHHVETWVTQRETWRRTAAGWKLYRVDSIRDQRRLIDGQPG